MATTNNLTHYGSYQKCVLPTAAVPNKVAFIGIIAFNAAGCDECQKYAARFVTNC